MQHLGKLQISFFGNKDVKFKSFFSTGKQFDSNSCGMWLVSGICTFVLNLPNLNDRSSAFDICCNLLDKATHVKLLINETTCVISHFNFNEQANMFTTAQSLINILTNKPENSGYFKKTAPKGFRTNFFYVTDTSIANINADDNGAYQNTRKTTRTYSYIQGNVNTVYEENGNYYFNKRVSLNQYSKCYKPIFKNASVLPHGNTGEHNSKRSYFLTSREILDKVKKQVKLGKAPKKIYDEIDNESGGVFQSTSQGAELRDTRQV